jgi:hypothetical protein
MPLHKTIYKLFSIINISVYFVKDVKNAEVKAYLISVSKMDRVIARARAAYELKKQADAATKKALSVIQRALRSSISKRNATKTAAVIAAAAAAAASVAAAAKMVTTGITTTQMTANVDHADGTAVAKRALGVIQKALRSFIFKRKATTNAAAFNFTIQDDSRYSRLSASPNDDESNNGLLSPCNPFWCGDHVGDQYLPGGSSSDSSTDDW